MQLEINSVSSVLLPLSAVTSIDTISSCQTYGPWAGTSQSRGLLWPASNWPLPLLAEAVHYVPISYPSASE